MTTCPHTRCGGCALLQLTAAEQLVRKQGHVRAAFARYAPLEALELPPPSAAQPAFAYRTRAKLVVSSRGEIGLYARGTHEVVDIPGCLVLSPMLLSMVAALRELFAQARAPLAGVDLREVQAGEANTDHGVLITLLGEARDEASLRALAARVAELEHVRGVALGLRAPRAAQLLGDIPVRVQGVEVAKDALSARGPYHYATYGAFVQAHRSQAQAISDALTAQLTAHLGTLQGKRILELYAGSGAFGLALAQRGARVVFVERYEPALALVARAASEQRISGVATRAGDAEVMLQDLVQQAHASGSSPALRGGENRISSPALRGGENTIPSPALRGGFDAIVVNPPRRGLSPLVRARIAALAPELVLYVSCEPLTLARDLADFAQRGLSAVRAQPFDMMPQSDDVECVVTLAPAPPTPLRILYEDEQLIAVDKPPHLPTIPQSEHDSSLLARLQTQCDVKQLFAVHRLDEGTSGVCLFAKRGEHVAPLSAALAAGQKHYLALVRGVTHEKGTIKTQLRDGDALRDAITRYTRKRVLSGHAFLRVRPEQGRKHQVRRHLASIGHPVVGDARYGAEPTNRHFEHRHGLDRTFLHLARIELPLPGRDAPLVLESPLAPDLEAVLAQLGETPR